MTRGSFRRTAPLLRVSYRRIAARIRPVALIAIGAAIAAAALATLLAVRVVVEDRALGEAVAAFPAGQRAIVVSWVGRDAADPRPLDDEARRALLSIGMGRPIRAAVFRTQRFGTELVRLAALDDLDDLVEIRSGRAPAPCSAAACELVALDAPSEPLAAQAFPVVGRVTERGGAPLDALVSSRAPGERLLLANGVEGLLAQPVLRDVFRTVTWLVPLGENVLDASDLDGFEERVTRAETQLRLRSTGFGVRAPLEELTAAGKQARLASRRELLVAGQFVALFLAFAVLAAARIRRNARETRYRLRRFGALRWQVVTETTIHAAILLAPAVLAGWLAGLALGSGIAAAADRPVTSVLERSSLSAVGFVWAVTLVAVGVVAVVVTVRAPSIEIRGLRLTVADVAAVGAVAVVATAVGVRETDGGSVEGSGTLLLLLPLLIAFAASVIAGRVAGPAFRLAERAAPKVHVSLRLVLLSLARNSGPAAFAVVFLVVAAGLAVFAAAYHATLAANQRETAAYSVPLDYVVRRDAVRGRALGGPVRLDAFYGGRSAVGIVRREGDAPTLNRTTRLTVLGLPPAALERLRWRSDYAEQSRAELAREITWEGRADLRGVDLPSGARELVFPSVVRGDEIRLIAAFRRGDGGFTQLELPESSGSNARTLRLPRALAGGRLVGLTLAFPPIEAFTAAHRATGSRPAPDVFRRGTLRLGVPFARTEDAVRPLAVDYRDWVRLDGTGTGGSSTSLALRYLLTQERTFRIRLRQPTDARPVPVIASGSLAATAPEGTVLPVSVGDADIEVVVAATAARFPTVAGDAVVADRAALETAVNAAAPGVAVADEVWLEGPEGQEERLRDAAPFPVAVVSRSAIEDRLRADPVSRAVSISLFAGVLVSLVLAIAGVLLAVEIDLRDEAAELFDLEALGLAPARLARHVWLRWLAIVALGLVGGLLAGAVIALVVTDIVALTANATAAEPPLRFTADWNLLAVGVAAFAAATLAFVMLLARWAFRGAAAERAGFG